MGVSSGDSRQSRAGQFADPGKVSRLDHHMSFSSGSSVRMRPTIRGTSKRGRPRGSRRGGPVGGKGRGLLLYPPSKVLGSSPQSPVSLSPTSSGTTNDHTLQHGKYSVCWICRLRNRSIHYR